MAPTHYQTDRTLQTVRTTLPPAEVLARAVDYFTERPGVYTAFLEHEGPQHVVLRGQGGEELVVGAAEDPDGVTAVRGSSYLFDAHVARFLATLPPAPALEPPAETAPLDG